MLKTAQNTDKLSYNVTKSANFLGVSPSTLRNLEAQGKITALRDKNGYRLFKYSDLETLKEKLSSKNLTQPTVVPQEPQNVKYIKTSTKKFKLAALLLLLILVTLPFALNYGSNVYKAVLSKAAVGILLNNEPTVLQATNAIRDFSFNVYIPANFKDTVSIIDIDDATETYLEATLDIAGEVTGTGLTGVIISDNVIDGTNLIEEFEYTGNFGVDGTFSIIDKWELDGTEITSTADEINSIGTIESTISTIDGITSTANGIYFSNGSKLVQDATDFAWNPTTNALTLNAVSYIFPSSQATASNYVLSNDGSGNLTWNSVSGVGGIDGTGTANYIPYFTDSNTLAISNLYYDGANVGIGTTSPKNDFHLVGEGGIVSHFESSDNDAYIRLESQDGSYVHIGNDGNSVLSLSGNTFSTDFLSISAAGAIYLGGDSNTYWSHPAADTFAWTTGGAEAMRIDSTGNVGIGTTSPLGKLNIQGAGTTTGFSLLTQDSAGAHKFAVLDSGNVGIGTTGPNELLHIRAPATTDGFLEIEADNYYRAGIKLTSGDPGGASYDWRISHDENTPAGGYLQFDENGTVGMVVGTGSVGMGTVSPASHLEIMYAGDTELRLHRDDDYVYTNDKLGSILFSSDDASANNTVGVSIIAQADANWSSGDTPGRLTFWTTIDGTETLAERMRIDSNGNVGIGTTAPSSILQIAGTFLPTTNDSFDLGSDSLRWQDLYLGPSTLHIGTSTSDEYTLNYDTTNNFLGFNVNGSGNPEIVFDSSGNVGIGTTNPTTALNVNQGAILRLGSIDAGITGAVDILSGSDYSTFTDVFRAYYGSTEVFEIKVSGSADSGNWQRGTVLSNAVNSRWMTVASDNIRFMGGTSNDSIYMDVLSSGNVGIGTTSPLGKLNIQGAGTTTGFSLLTQDSAGAHKFAVLDSGNVGIGTTGPGAMLHLSDSTESSVLRFESQDTVVAKGNIYGTIEFNTLDSSDPGTAAQIQVQAEGTNAQGRMTFYTGSVSSPSQTMSLHGNKVGIGLTNPSTNLHIYNALSEPAFRIEGGDTTVQAGESFGRVDFYTNDSSGAGITGFIDNIAVDTNTNSVLTFGTKEFGSDALERMRINSIGNIGIGTTSPLGKLNIQGAGTTTGFSLLTQDSAGAHKFAVLDSGNVGIGTTGPGAKLHLDGGNTVDTPLGDIVMSRYWASVTDTRASAIFHYDASVPGGANDMMVFGVSGDMAGVSQGRNKPNQISRAKMVITSAGNVGIGTTSPLGKLNIQGAGTTTGFSLLTQDSAGAHKFAVLDSGNVGIGTTGPGRKLHIYDSNIAYTKVEGVNWGILEILGLGSANSAIRQGAAGDGLQMYGGDQLEFWVNADGTPLQAMEITTVGNVGIGTTAPGDKLSVAGGALIGSGYAGIGITAPANGLLVQGNVGIGTTAPGRSLEVTSSSFFEGGFMLGADSQGNFFDDASNGAGSTTMYIGNETIDTTVSDERLKENIVPSEINGLDVISQFEVKDFDWLEDNPRKDRGRATGLIAQEVYEYLPQVVRKPDNPENTWSVEYHHIVPFLIKGIQEQQTQLDALDIENIFDIYQEIKDFVSALGLSADDTRLLVSTDLNVLGASTLADVTVTGDLSVGLLNINSLENSISLVSDDTLFIQNHPLAGNIDIFNGKIKLENDGTIVAGAYAIREDSNTIGSSTLLASQTEITIQTTAVTSNSKIFITATSSTDGAQLYVTDKIENESFKVKIDDAISSDIDFDWWIVDVK